MCQTGLSKLTDDTLDDVALKIASMTTHLSYEQCDRAERLIQVDNRIGRESMLNIICVVIKLFSETIRSKDKMKNYEIIESANYLIETYKYESLEDILLAFKSARFRGDVFHFGLEQNKITSHVMKPFLDEKIAWREAQEHLKKKNHHCYIQPANLQGEEREIFLRNMQQVKDAVTKVEKKFMPSLTQNYYQQKLLNALPSMSVEDMLHAKEQYQLHPKDFENEIKWIDNELRQRT